MKKKIPFCVCFAVLQASCTNNSSIPERVSTVLAFSNRVQPDISLVTIRLKTPPLLSNATIKNAKAEVTPYQKKLILDEQAAFEKKLAAISKDIQIIYRYRFVFNGMALAVPKEFIDQITQLPELYNLKMQATVQASSQVGDKALSTKLPAQTSTDFIGATNLHKRGITGKGVRVGIIDTGIDYTHSMFGGSGDPAEFTKMDPDVVVPGTFPTQKVVGGFDFVGRKYDFRKPGSMPKPDANPIDDHTHGTHVAGTVAGKGDGVNVYDGIAPDAELYSLKVFSSNIFSDSSAIMAAMEYAVDPNNDFNPADRLDVVNLSLCVPFGSEFSHLHEASVNLVRGGTLAVFAAGNDGDVPFAVADPSTADGETSLSVAASIDAMDHNWRFPASRFIIKNTNYDFMVSNASSSLPSLNAGDLEGKIVPVGTACNPLTNEQAIQLKGNIALVDLGDCSFNDTVKNAHAAGSTGIVLIKSKQGDPYDIQTEEIVPYPVVMVKLDDGRVIKQGLESADVRVRFFVNTRIDKPELIDSIARFSSRGPRMFDGLIKPEITAPGKQVISAAAGTGNKGVRFAGTSMATPHIAGVYALLRQVYPQITASEARARIMNTAKILGGNQYFDVALQGAGRVQAEKAVDAKVLVYPQALSLGIVPEKMVIRKEITLVNSSSEMKEYKFTANTKPGLTFIVPNNIRIYGGYSQKVILNFKIEAEAGEKNSHELDGFVYVTDVSTQQVDITLPVLAIVKKESHMQVSRSWQYARTAFIYNDNYAAPGEAFVMDFLDTQTLSAKSHPCELAAAGYRKVNREMIKNDNIIQVPILQIAVDIARPTTFWVSCEVSVLLDSNGQGKVTHELIGLGGGVNQHGYANFSDPKTILFDALKMHKIAQNERDPVKLYSEAIVYAGNIKSYTNTKFQLLEIPVESLPTQNGKIIFQIASAQPTFDNADSFDGSDSFLDNSKTSFLGNGKWYEIDLNTLPFLEGDEVVKLKNGETVQIAPKRKSIVFMPFNATMNFWPFQVLDTHVIIP